MKAQLLVSRPLSDLSYCELRTPEKTKQIVNPTVRIYNRLCFAHTKREKVLDVLTIDY